MAHEIDWLSSQAGMCKVNLYSPSGSKEQERKVICFVDVSNLNPKESNHSMNIGHDPPEEVDLGNLAEKEIIIIKDDEQCNHMNTEGAVCLFKQGSSDDLNVVSWLSKDLQKYAVGFHHALTPSSENQNKPNSFDSPRPDKASQNNNNTAPNSSLNENPDDLAYYANKLCSLVVEMTRKEIKDKWESSGKCIRQTISPNGTVTKTVTTEGMEGSKGPQDRSVRIDDPFQSDSCQNNFKESERYADTAKKHEEYTSVSKGMMLCANQAASDMMLSFLKTMKVQKGKQAQPACAVLKEVLLRHTKEIVSDFIDSSMKNLHNITGALMTDSDFVCAVKKNLYNVGIQKTVEILEAIVKRLFKLLEDKSYRSQNLGFAAFKTTTTQGNQRTQGMQFATMKTDAPIPGKDRGGGPAKPYPSGSKVSDNQASLDVYAKEILVTALSQIQQHLLEKCRDRLARREGTPSSFGSIHQDQSNDRSPGSYNSKPREGRLDYNQSEALKEKAGLILSMVHKVLNEAGLTCEQNRR